jgi:osmotically-inducible protein OsmY
MATLAEHIERRLARAGLPAAVEEVDGKLVLTGMVMTEEERRAVLDIAAAEAPLMEIEDNIEVGGVLAEEIGGLRVSGLGTEAGETSEPETSDETFMPGDFEDQRLLKDPLAASGPSESEGDLVAEGEVSYVPPTDPVMTSANEVLGGFAITSMDQVGAARSSDETIGDEAIADAVRRELAEDAATAGLDIEVTVEQGVVRLRGRVTDIEDAENAEEVASRVPGVVSVEEELELETL